MGFFKDFKAFAMKGNLADVAIAFVMGGAFGKVVTSFTEGLVSPIVGLITGGQDFSKKKWVLRQSVAEVKDPSGQVVQKAAEEVAFQWGAFFTNVIDFIIVALVCYWIIRAVMRKDPNAAPAPTKTEQLLTEIRDSLKK